MNFVSSGSTNAVPWTIPDRRGDCEHRLICLVRDVYYLHARGEGDDGGRGCDAGNEHFAKRYNLHPSSVRDLFHILITECGLFARNIRKGRSRQLRPLVPLHELAQRWPRLASLLAKERRPVRELLASAWPKFGRFLAGTPRLLRAEVRAAPPCINSLKRCKREKQTGCSDTKSRQAPPKPTLNPEAAAVVARLTAQGVWETTARWMVQTLGRHTCETTLTLLAWHRKRGKNIGDAAGWLVAFSKRLAVGEWQLPPAFTRDTTPGRASTTDPAAGISTSPFDAPGDGALARSRWLSDVPREKWPDLERRARQHLHEKSPGTLFGLDSVAKKMRQAHENDLAGRTRPAAGSDVTGEPPLRSRYPQANAALGPEHLDERAAAA